MKPRSLRIPALSTGGLLLGPGAWALNTQLGQILPHPDCATGWPLTALASAGCLVLAVIGAAMSGRAAVGASSAASDAATERFVALLGALNGLVFTFALLLQAVAALVIPACAH